MARVTRKRKKKTVADRCLLYIHVYICRLLFRKIIETKISLKNRNLFRHMWHDNMRRMLQGGHEIRMD